MRRIVVILLIVACGLAVAWLLRESGDAAPDATVASRRAESSGALPTFVRELDGQPGPDVPVPSSAMPEALAERDLVRLTILHADGVPAAGCLVVVRPDEGSPWRAATSETGYVTTSRTTPGGDVWVAGATLSPVNLGRWEGGEHATLRLPAGEVLEGRVLVDGAPPREAFALGLWTPAVQPPLVSAPAKVRALFARPELGLNALRSSDGQLIQGDGHFRFSGLPAGFDGYFEFPDALQLEEGESAAAPLGHARLLRLRRAPRLRFRVLAPDGEAAPNAAVNAALQMSDGLNQTELRTDDAGRGEMVLDPMRGRITVTLVISDAAGTGRLQFTREVLDPAHDVDFGDLRLEPAWTVTFRALDPQGAPLAGAIGATECPDLQQSGPTGADGLGRVTGVAQGCAQLCVTAAHCDIVSVPVPSPPPTTPIDVVLAPCAYLEVRVVSDDGAPTPGLTLHVRMKTTNSSRDETGFHEVHRQLNQDESPRRRVTSQSSADGTYALDMGWDFPVPESGVIRFGCVRPGDPVDLRLVDVTGHAVATREGLQLQPQEQTVVVLPVSQQPGRLEVLVTDAAGQPLEGATLRVTAAEPLDDMAAGRVEKTITDARGLFRLEPVYAPLVNVNCAHHGFAPEYVQAAPGAGQLHVVLGAGLTVTVHFVDAEGRPAPVPNASVTRQDGVSMQRAQQGRNFGSSAVEPRADWVFAQLPEAPLLISTYLTGRKLEWPHDPKQPDARCVVPALGSLVVRGPLGSDEDGLRLNVQGDEPGVGFRAWPDEAAKAAGEMRWPVVLAGRYQVTLERSVGVSDERVAVRGPVTVEVKAGAEAVADLR